MQYPHDAVGSTSRGQTRPARRPSTHREQAQVLRQELGQVDVGDGAQDQDVLRLVGELELQVAGRRQN